MFHLELFHSGVGVSAAFQQLTYFKSSNILPAINNGAQVSATLPYVKWVAAISTNIGNVRLQAPSMLPFPYPTLAPNNRATISQNPPRVWDFSAAPIPLRPTEEFDVFCTMSGAAGEAPNVGVLFTDNVVTPAPAGRFFSAHWTAAVTTIAGGWTVVQPIFDQALPAGFYALIGARVMSASAQFFRLFPAMAPLWRPGGLAVTLYDQMDSHKQRGFDSYGGPIGPWGVWLSFYQNVPPQVEVFTVAADPVVEGLFDLIQVSQATSIPNAP
jgi:hypothetical protein